MAEAKANRIRRIDPSGIVRTIIGGAGRGFGGDGGGTDETLIDNPYSILVTDRPSTYLELRIGDHAKRVRLYNNFPKELGAIPTLIDQAVRVEQWIGTDCERPRSSIGPARQAGECER